MAKMVELFGRRHFGVMPVSFVLPAEREQLKEAMAHDSMTGTKRTWIVKPAASACGRGIFLATTLDETPQAGDVDLSAGGDGRHYVVEHYIVRCSLGVTCSICGSTSPSRV